MAFVHGKLTGLALGAYDISQYLRDSSMSSQLDMAETSTYGNTYKTFIQGLANTSVSMSGLWDGATGAADELFTALLATDAATPLTICPNGIATGNVAYAIGVQEASYEITSPVTDVVSFSASMSSRLDSGGKRGKALYVGAITATGVQASVDMGAAGPSSGGFCLHVTANTHNNTVNIVVQESSNNGTDPWATIATFTQIPAATTAGEFVLAGPTERYLRVSATCAGTGSASVIVAASLA